MKLKKVIPIVGLVLGAAGMATPVVMGQSILTQKKEKAVAEFGGQKFTMKEVSVLSKDDTKVYSKPDVESKVLETLGGDLEFAIKGYSKEFAVVDYKDKDAFIHLSDLNLEGTGIKYEKPKVKEEKKEEEKVPVFSATTIDAFKELEIDLGNIDLTDESLYQKSSLTKYKDAAIEYGKAMKADKTQPYEELKAAFEEAKANLLLKDGEYAIPKPKEEEPEVEPAPEVKETPAPAPSAERDESKFAFPTVPTGLDILDGKTLAAVSFKATTMANSDFRSSPNQSVGSSIATIPAETELDVVAISTDGVAKVVYNGQTGYVNSVTLR